MKLTFADRIRENKFFVILLGALLSLWGYFLYSSYEHSRLAPHAGKMAPAFVVYTETDQPVSSESLQGKYVLLHFWATWCGPCEKEMPLLQGFLETFKADSSFIPLIVSVDMNGKKDTDSFQKRFEITIPFYFDKDSKAADAFGTYKIPETYLIDPSGRILKKWVGPVRWNDPGVEAELRRYLSSFGKAD